MLVVDLGLLNQTSRRQQSGQEGRGEESVDTASRTQRKKEGAVWAWCVASVDASLKPEEREEGDVEVGNERENKPGRTRIFTAPSDSSIAPGTSAPRHPFPRLALPLSVPAETPNFCSA